MKRRQANDPHTDHHRASVCDACSGAIRDKFMRILNLIIAYRSLPKSEKEKIKSQLSIVVFGFMVVFVAYIMVADPSIKEQSDGRFLMTQYSQLISEERIMNLAKQHCFEMGLALTDYEIKKDIGGGGGAGNAASRYYHYFSCK